MSEPITGIQSIVISKLNETEEIFGALQDAVRTLIARTESVRLSPRPTASTEQPQDETALCPVVQRITALSQNIRCLVCAVEEAVRDLQI